MDCVESRRPSDSTYQAAGLISICTSALNSWFSTVYRCYWSVQCSMVFLVVCTGRISVLNGYMSQSVCGRSVTVFHFQLYKNVIV